jgi:hypothetical protein
MYGLGIDRYKDLPVIGAVHSATDYIISELFGCKSNYFEDSDPQVYPANHEELKIYNNDIFKTLVFKKLEHMLEKLKIHLILTHGIGKNDF